MAFISILLAIVIVYIIQMKLFAKHNYENLEYDIKLSAEEVFEGEDIFIFEEISNNKTLPVPYAKVDTELPDGLKFRLQDKKNPDSKRDIYSSHIQSVFVLKSNQKIKRRWRVNCKTRGVYNLGNVIIVTNDLFGFNAQSKRFEVGNKKYNQIVVLPKAIDLDEHFTSTYYYSGDVLIKRSLISDPLRIAGAREYNSYDSMNKINWKSTAVHNKLMVNNEEYTQRNQFNIVLNMQSRDIELHPYEPSSQEYIELCITVCASIFDKVSNESIPVKLFANTPPESVGENSVSDDKIGKQILITNTFQGKRDIVNALRLLSNLKMQISCSIEQMLDHILQYSNYYADNGNIIIISSYINERMINFHDVIGKQGIKVIFYITTGNNNVINIPNNVEVHFKTYI